MVKKSFKENAIFFHEKKVILTLELYAQVFFALDQYIFKKYGSKTLLLRFNIYEIEKSFTEVLSPPWPN